MKVTVVPAQVTTLEDRIAGNLGLSQLLLLSAPIFGGSALYVLLPPFMHSALYKLLVIGLLAVMCSALAIRIRGKIVLLWLIILFRYNIRPRYYVYDKRSTHGREQFSKTVEVLEVDIAEKPSVARKLMNLSAAEIFELEKVLDNPSLRLRYETRKGGLYVRITEVKEQG